MRTVTISSGKGGVGKSNVAVNLGLALAQDGKRVLLFDADLGLANLDILFGFSSKRSVADIVDASHDIRDVLLDGPHGLRVLPASSGVLDLERLSADQRLQIIECIQEASEDFDLLIVDTGAGLTDNVLFFASSADDVVIVTTPEPTAMADSYALIKVLNRGKYSGRFTLLVNRVSDPAQGVAVHERLSSVSRRFLGVQLHFYGSLMHDAALEAAVRLRQPVMVSHPNSTIAGAFRSLAGRFDEAFPTGEGMSGAGFWNRWLQNRTAERAAMRR
ncbi:MAG: MinD/ParA family protein [Proteobacteria bacterium]|nr:MinD/ParA family protein [Pseudomonadota bacterium]